MALSLVLFVLDPEQTQDFGHSNETMNSSFLNHSLQNLDSITVLKQQQELQHTNDGIATCKCDNGYTGVDSDSIIAILAGLFLLNVVIGFIALVIFYTQQSQKKNRPDLSNQS